MMPTDTDIVQSFARQVWKQTFAGPGHLTDEQRSLLLSARKEPGKYVEGVVLSDNLEALFRNVPPPLCLALAMTEKHEKAERAQIMRERHCSELEAVYLMAERIVQHRST